MLCTTSKNKFRSTLANISKENQDVPSSTPEADSDRIGQSIKNLSTFANSTKYKKSDMTKSKKSDLPKANFARINFGTDFLTSEAKTAFIHLPKAFTKAPILRHFDLKYHICIETNVLEYFISGVLSQMTLDQSFFDYVTHENLESNLSKYEIGQWHLVAFFSKKMVLAETQYKMHN